MKLLEKIRDMLIGHSKTLEAARRALSRAIEENCRYIDQLRYLSERYSNEKSAHDTGHKRRR